mgnify:CR=1 FL=1
MSDAYREAYNTENMKPATVHREAHALMANPKIAARVQRLLKQRDRAVVASSITDRERVLDKLRHLMDHAGPADNVRIRAAELLGKSVGLFKDVQLTEVETKTSEELTAELQKKLAGLLTDPDFKIN